MPKVAKQAIMFVALAREWRTADTCLYGQRSSHDVTRKAVRNFIHLVGKRNMLLFGGIFQDTHGPSTSLRFACTTYCASSVMTSQVNSGKVTSNEFSLEPPPS